MSKLLCKHIASFDYFDKSLTVLSAKCGSISITQFATFIREPVGIPSASFSLTFSIFFNIVKNSMI